MEKDIMFIKKTLLKGRHDGKYKKIKFENLVKRSN